VRVCAIIGNVENMDNVTQLVPYTVTSERLNKKKDVVGKHASHELKNNYICNIISSTRRERIRTDLE